MINLNNLILSGKYRLEVLPNYWTGRTISVLFPTDELYKNGCEAFKEILTQENYDVYNNFIQLFLNRCPYGFFFINNYMGISKQIKKMNENIKGIFIQGEGQYFYNELSNFIDMLLIAKQYYNDGLVTDEDIATLSYTDIKSKISQNAKEKMEVYKEKYKNKENDGNGKQ